MLRAAAPNYCICTVLQARDLRDKTKNGIDAYCVISMGKDKFATAVCEKTSSPQWGEECEMQIDNNATIKLTVYHKNKGSLLKEDNFIGRAYVSLRDLQDYDRVHTNWHKLTNKDGKFDKDRGEIEVSLQFYSKNNATGSVLDLATKKKHSSLKDIRRALSKKFKTAKRHQMNDPDGSDSLQGDSRSRMNSLGGSGNNFRTDESPSESTSYMGSLTSLNSLQYNDSKQPKKKSYAPANGVGSITPHSSRRSVTSDYETSSILDSASMHDGDEFSLTSATSPSQQYREVLVDNAGISSNVSNKMKTRESSTSEKITKAKSTDAPTIPISKDSNRNTSVFNVETETTFANMNKTKAKGTDATLTPDTLFGLSTIKENFDVDESSSTLHSPKHTTDDEIDFGNYFNQMKQSNKGANAAKTNITVNTQQTKSFASTKDQSSRLHSQSDDIPTPSASISTKLNTSTNSSTTISSKKQNLDQNDSNDSTDDDVDEVLGKFERISSMRSSSRRKIQPRDDIMQDSYTENDNRWTNNYDSVQTIRTTKSDLPDIVGTPTVKARPPIPSTTTPRKQVNNGLNVLGYTDVKSTPINTSVRKELEYLDRDELLHVIAHQMDLLKKRDVRVKDLEQYTADLLVKIVDQCPNILQVRSSIKR